jgi:hypothetical protein
MSAGDDNKTYQNISHSTITDNSKTYNIENIGTAQFVYQSLDYQDLTKRIAEKQELIEAYQLTGKTDKALKAGAELEALEQQLEQFKADVLRLYETFTKIEINSERLAKAKAYFDQGQFREADAILNADDMAQDLARLLEREQQLDQEKAEIARGKTQLADEYVIKARLQAVAYDNPHWFEQACQYFEAALKAIRNPTTLFEYALFLQNHNCFDQAKPLYQEFLDQSRTLAAENPRTYLPNVAMTLNNLAVLQQAQNDFETAQTSYEEALQIRRTLAAENPRTYLPDVAMTLINLSIFYLQAMPDQEKSIGMATEALEILQGFAGVPYLERYAATALQVLQANGVEVAQN